jgi:monofunctional biosynthetic peptidoglycan transglycosylase
MAKKSKSSGGILKFIKIIFILAVIVTVGFIGVYLVYPDVTILKKINPKKTSFMEYRENQWQVKGKKLTIQKKWVSLSRISPYLVKAIIIAEDDKFWSHRGFDMDAIQNALEKNIEKGKFKFGGSTISQQLVKNLYLTPAKNPVRKLKEAIITWRVEQTISKRRILELYLNVVEWGSGIFGAEMASQRYFGKPAALLTAEEAAKLAVILPNPIRFKVDGTSRYTERRAKIIYNIMVKRGIVIPDYEEVIKTPHVEIPEENGAQTESGGTRNTLEQE